jgi:hypothetical protein|tara:strand:+ start:51 stop:299 length:249 start_codon:yes stop_codon:yes gene_type:complete
MSHPGNDEIIDIKRDSQTHPLDPKRYALIDEMVHHATKMGIGVVQEIAEETLKRKPGCTVKELMKILDQYLEQRNDQANTNE